MPILKTLRPTTTQLTNEGADAALCVCRLDFEQAPETCWDDIGRKEMERAHVQSQLHTSRCSICSFLGDLSLLDVNKASKDPFQAMILEERTHIPELIPLAFFSSALELRKLLLILGPRNLLLFLCHSPSRAHSMPPKARKMALKAKEAKAKPAPSKKDAGKTKKFKVKAEKSAVPLFACCGLDWGLMDVAGGWI